MLKKYCIFGTGGFAKEVLSCLVDELKSRSINFENKILFIEDDNSYLKENMLGVPVIKQSEFTPKEYKAFIAIGSPKLREIVVNSLPKETEFFSVKHPTAVVSEWVNIGVGSIVSAGTILTCDIKIGKHAHLNLNTTIGHDCNIGDYFTTAPGVNISGNCNFGHRVYFGTNSCARQGVNITSDVTIGMGGVVLKEISNTGTYIGSPVRALSQK